MRSRQFMDAKRVLRLHPGWTDEQVAEVIGVTSRDRTGMETIVQARKDVAAGDSFSPHVP